MGVTVEHRRAMLSNLATALITHGRIQTTLAKAKVLRPFIEKVITKAKQAAAKTDKKDALHLRRLALSDVCAMRPPSRSSSTRSTRSSPTETAATPASISSARSASATPPRWR